MSVGNSGDTILKLFGYNAHGQQEDKMVCPFCVILPPIESCDSVLFM